MSFDSGECGVSACTLRRSQSPPSPPRYVFLQLSCCGVHEEAGWDRCAYAVQTTAVGYVRAWGRLWDFTSFWHFAVVGLNCPIFENLPLLSGQRYQICACSETCSRLVSLCLGSSVELDPGGSFLYPPRADLEESQISMLSFIFCLFLFFKLISIFYKCFLDRTKSDSTVCASLSLAKLF